MTAQQAAQEQTILAGARILAERKNVAALKWNKHCTISFKVNTAPSSLYHTQSTGATFWQRLTGQTAY